MSKKILSNTNTEIEILKSGNIILDEKVLNSGNLRNQADFEKNPNIDKLEKTTWTFSGRAKVGTDLKIGTVSFAADQLSSDNINKYYKTPPYLLSNNNNKNTKSKTTLKYNSVVRDTDNKIIKYVFDIIHRVGEVNNNNLNYYIKEKIKDKLKERTGVTGIDSVEVGDNIIQPLGEKRKITITGSVGSTVTFTITKLTNEVRDSDGIIIAGQSYNEEKALVDSSVTYNLVEGRDYKPYTYNVGQNGEGFSVLAVKIPASGKISFYHHFPRNVLGVFSNRYVFRVSGDFTDAFKAREDWYDSADDLSAGNVLAGKGWSGGYRYKVLTQVVNPKLQFTLTGTWNVSDVKVTSSDGVYNNVSHPGWSSFGSRVHTGRRNTLTKNIKSTVIFKEHDYVYTFQVTTGSHSFALRSGSDGAGGTLGAPKFSSVLGEESDWTNSIPYDNSAEGTTGNGGTEFTISGVKVTISTTSSSNDTITIQFTAKIIRYGSKNIISTLDVDKIATLS